MSVTAERFGAICGALLAAGFIAGLALLDLPGHDDGDRRLNEFYADSGNRLRVILGSYCWAFGGIALIGLGAVLSARVERWGAPLPLVRLALLCASVSGTLLIGAAAAQAPTYALSINAFDEPQSELTRATIPHIGYSLLLFSMLVAAAFIAAAAVALQETRALPRWVAWSGFVAAALLVFSLIFMPMAALPVWALAVAAALWRATPIASTT